VGFKGVKYNIKKISAKNILTGFLKFSEIRTVDAFLNKIFLYLPQMKTHTFIFCCFQLLVFFAKSQTGEIALNDLPCKSSTLNFGKEYYYGYGYGISTDLSVARTKANVLATQELASAIKSQLHAVATLYTRQNNNDHTQEFESLINETVNETIEGGETICQIQEKVEGGKIKIYMAISLRRAELLKRVEAKAQESRYGKLDFDREKFEEIFNKELEKKN
jgi:hypothetical protein